MRQDDLGLPSENFSHRIYLAASREPSLWHYVVRDRHTPPLDWSITQTGYQDFDKTEPQELQPQSMSLPCLVIQKLQLKELSSTWP